MKRISNFTYILILGSIAMLLLTACGSGAGQVIDHTPQLSNLTYTPTSFTKNQGGGAVNIQGSMDFIDANSDIVTFKASIDGITKSYDRSDLKGTKSGTITGYVPISTASTGNFTFKVWVVDNAGNESDKLTGTFTVQ